jgi:hypothetical protein
VRHLTAALRAAPALLSALLHHFVAVTQTFAALRTPLADITAHATVLRMILAQPGHEISTGDAGLRAVCEYSLVFSRCVLAAFHQTVDGGFLAGSVAVQTGLNAFPHLSGHLAHVRHSVS